MLAISTGGNFSYFFYGTPVMPPAVYTNVFAMSGERERITRMIAPIRNRVPVGTALVAEHPILFQITA
jgi:hypothetical protein